MSGEHGQISLCLLLAQPLSLGTQFFKPHDSANGKAGRSDRAVCRDRQPKRKAPNLRVCSGEFLGKQLSVIELQSDNQPDTGNWQLRLICRLESAPTFTAKLISGKEFEFAFISFGKVGRGVSPPQSSASLPEAELPEERALTCAGEPLLFPLKDGSLDSRCARFKTTAADLCESHERLVHLMLENSTWNGSFLSCGGNMYSIHIVAAHPSNGFCSVRSQSTLESHSSRARNVLKALLDLGFRVYSSSAFSSLR
ncbi:hypothetical protein L1887_63056 [Cichorium endivia]|nr:hypothetical protein L1887_63056 [Cichorium endivia]